MKILIAEDDPVSRRVLEKTLLSWGYQVLVTPDGSAAWDALQRADAPSLAILDIMMPKMDGLEVCRKVRQLSFTVSPYLILLTATRNKVDVVKGLEAGANDYLTKPFGRDELRARVNVGVQMLELQRILAERVSELEAALAQVEQLQGLLPICSYCKKIRDDQNYWHKVESYLSARTAVKFSHGICPPCYEDLLRELGQRKRREGAPELRPAPMITN